MSWAESHKRSERLAAEAEAASRGGDFAGARSLYLEAAVAEVDAFQALEPEKSRTAGITAVSAASLFYKGGAFLRAESFVLSVLPRADIPSFANVQLRQLLQKLWSEAELSAAGLRFSKRDVLVSVKGGEIVSGGAPLDLILRKVEEIRALFYRTVEMLMERGFRKHGGPPIDIQRAYRPWLFQAAPGSYQFAVRLESTAQLELAFPGQVLLPEVEVVTSKFLEIVKAASGERAAELPSIVPDADYRGAFLKLTRNLAPTGKSYSSLEIRSAVEPSTPAIALVPKSRKALTETIKLTRPPAVEALPGELLTLSGVLRAVHLDDDWLEVTVIEAGHERHVKVQKAGDIIDDVIGPMVNRPVLVETRVLPTGKYEFIDIQAAE